MKIKNNIKLLGGMLMMSGMMFTSCNFLDIVPPEQADIEDAVQSPDATFGFLASCYNGIVNPLRYDGMEASTDEYVEPQLWDLNSQKIAWGMRHPNEPRDVRWTAQYRYIGQILLFLEQLPNAVDVPENTKKQYEAEAYFLLAYYHFELLRVNGPIPVTQQLLGFNVLPEDYEGRWHYDAVTDWIVDTIDEKVLAGDYLPPVYDTNNVGRITSVIAKALKAKALLYAASPLWNGSFPYPEWRNTNTTTVYKGKDYGTELVSKEYSPGKWERARIACEEALDAAIDASYALYKDKEMYKNDISGGFSLDENVYVPGLNAAEDPEATAFKETVLMYRYLSTARFNEGNKEIVWGLNKSDDSFLTASMPNNVMILDNGNKVNGYSGISPTLYTVKTFYNQDGTRVNPNDPDLLTRSNVDSKRPDIIRLNTGREARFYAWMVFDDGDYSTTYVKGKPLHVDFKDSQKQGFNIQENERNHSVTGYLAQKFMRPNHTRDSRGNQNLKQYPRPLIRMAELYLNLAECYAMLDRNTEALEFLNPVHTRGGLPQVEESDVTSERDMMTWIRDERFIELWGEGHRYHDLRRWAIAPEYLGAGKRTGLNAIVENPTFEEFNQEVEVNQPFVWNNNMYLCPLGYEESSKNRNLVQAPGFSQ